MCTPGSVDGVGHVSITLGARPTEGKPVEDVSVRMPLPESTINAALTATVGVAVFDERTKEVPSAYTTTCALACMHARAPRAHAVRRFHSP